MHMAVAFWAAWTRFVLLMRLHEGELWIRNGDEIFVYGTTERELRGRGGW